MKKSTSQRLGFASLLGARATYYVVAQTCGFAASNLRVLVSEAAASSGTALSGTTKNVGNSLDCVYVRKLGLNVDGMRSLVVKLIHASLPRTHISFNCPASPQAHCSGWFSCGSCSWWLRGTALLVTAAMQGL